MTDARRCPQCDAEIPVNSPAGLCPRCLLKASADSQSGAASVDPGPTKLTPPNSSFVPPTVEELAPLFPQLEILELLGKGGMGAVYKARQPGLDRLVALKILPPEISHDPAFAERFQREARALAKLSHPHIVAVYDFGQTPSPQRGEGVSHSPLSPSGRGAGSEGQLCYIVMEFIDGANLRQTIKAGKLAAAEALAIVPQICEALQFAHDEGIVHRDIKPENILIDKRGRVKIADFGLAKLLGTDASDHSLTATHQVMGTLRYMAPEQMQGSREVDHRADIYSLGVVFYELLTGELPMGRFAPPSKKVQVDVRLDEIVLRALEQEPEQRYQHASDVKIDLESVTSHSGKQGSVKLVRPATKLAKTISVPFDILSSWFWGAGAEGVLHFDGECLQIEFKQCFLGFFGGTLKTVVVPVSDIKSLELEESLVTKSLCLQTHRWNSLAELPGSNQAVVRLSINPDHQADALRLREAIVEAAATENTPETTPFADSGHATPPREALVAHERQGLDACERLLSTERRERIRAGLAEDEHLIWADKIGVAGTWRYALRVGLTLIGILAGFFVGSGGLRELARTGWDIGSFASSLVGVLFVLAIGVTALLAIGRRERVFYTLTDRRAIVWNFGRSGRVSVQSYGPAQLASAECIENRNGSGSLIFEKAPSYFSAARGFKDIDAVREVHELIRRVLLNQPATREHTTGIPNVARPESAKSTGTPLTQMRFGVPATTDIARQAIFHFSSFGYQVVKQQQDTVVFQRGGQRAGLWETDIRKIATRLTVRTAPAADWQQWVSCDWSVRTLGAWITRRDIAKLEAEGRGFESLLNPKIAATDAAAVSNSFREMGTSPVSLAGPGPFPLARRSTIVERELRGAWHWVAGDSSSPTQPPVFPGRLMILLSLAGCLMVMVPWLDVHIDQSANIRQLYGDGELTGPFSQTLFGFERWPGIAAAAAFGVLGLLLIITTDRHPPGWKRAAMMSGIAGLALLHTFLYKIEVEQGSFAVPVLRNDHPSGDFSSEDAERSRKLVMTKFGGLLNHIEHQATFRGGFYGSLALSVVLLVFSGIGVRRAEEQSDEKEMDADDELGAASRSLSRIRRQLKGPAIALMLYGLTLLFPGVLLFFNGFDIADGNDATPAAVGFGMIALSFLLLGLIGLLMRGGWHMLAVESHRAALLASFLGQPVGLWGLFVLSRPEVKAAFASVSRRSAETLGRPKLVPVLAMFNLIGAILLMLVCAMEQPPAFSPNVARVWRVWEKVDSVLGFTMAAGLFAASIGLFLWKSWARKLTLGVCVFGLASFVFDAPYLARFVLPDIHADIQQTIIDEGIEPEARDFVALFTIVVLFGGMSVVGLTWLIGQLVYFTRPRVVAAFESQGEKHGKFVEWLFTASGAVVGVLSVFGPLALLLGLSAVFERGNLTSNQKSPALPPLGTITNGIGAEFTVPAGQVAVFEIVTRRDNETVPVPPHCGYVMAPPDTPVAGTFRWSRKPEKDIAAGRSREWSLEIVTGSSNGYTEAILLPDELNAAVGSRKISLGALTPNEEAVHWGTIDTRDLPANGLIGLRVTVVAHEFKTGGSGNAHIDWKKAESATSTTRRKLSADSLDSLHSVAEKGDVARVKQLIDGGVSINSKDADGQTPLMKAVAGGHKSLALTLILLGADLAEQDQRGRTAEMIAAEKRDATFLSRLKALSEMSYDRDPAKRKERLRSFAGIEPSLLAGRDVDLLYFSPYEAERLKDNDGENALMKAARSGDWECFNLLATQLDTMVAQDKLGRTVLMHAVLGGHAYESRWKEQIEWLTKSPYFGIAGVDNIYVGAMVVFDLEKSLSVLDRDAKSVLQLAEQHQHTEVARILRRHLEMIITNQTAAIEKSGDDVAKHYRLRGLAWQALGNQQQAEAEFKKAIKD